MPTSFSQLCAYYNANADRLPAAPRGVIRRAAVDRLKARFAEGRADSALDFSKELEALETLVAPK